MMRTRPPAASATNAAARPAPNPAVAMGSAEVGHVVAVEHGGEQIVCEVLLEVELRVGVDLVAGIDQLVGQLVDAIADGLLERLHRLRVGGHIVGAGHGFSSLRE